MTTNEQDLDVRFDGEPLEALSAAWIDPDLSLGQRARAVSRYYTESHLTLEGAARVLEASPALLEALLGLATLDDDDLVLLSDANPPKTTWLLFANADSGGIRAGLRSLELSGSDEESAAARVYDAIREVAAPSIEDRIAGISSKTLGHLSHKAKEYAVLSPKARMFLVDIAKKKTLGTVLTEKQLAWLTSILSELVERDVVCRDSPDNDQAECDEVLAALGR